MSLFFQMLLAGAKGVQSPNISGLNNLTSLIILGTDRPQCSIRFNSDGTVDDATGDTGSALSYSQTGSWIVGAPEDTADWEVVMSIIFEDVTNANSFTGGLAGETYVDTDTNPVITLTKDTALVGNSAATFTFTVRNKTDTSNSDTTSTIQFNVNISA